MQKQLEEILAQGLEKVQNAKNSTDIEEIKLEFISRTKTDSRRICK